MKNRLFVTGVLGLSLFLSAAASHAAADRPNVVFIFSDDQRADTIHALGNERIMTPNIDRLVGGGVAFRNTYIMGATSGAVCRPSRNMLLSGRSLYHIAPAGKKDAAIYGGNEIPPEHITLAEQFRKNGYRTHIIGKWHNDEGSLRRSFDDSGWIYYKSTILRPAPKGYTGPTGHEAMPLRTFENFKTTEIFSGRHSTDIFGEAAVAFIQEQPKDEPFFLYLPFHAPHDPVMAPAKYEAMYPADRMVLPENFSPDHPFETGALRIRPFVVKRERTDPPYTGAEMKRIIGLYYAMITHLDVQVGRIMDALNDTGKMENTIIVFAADNGFSLGDHGLVHKQSVYEQDVHVPLIMVGPGLPQGELRDSLCYTIDIYPTLCELAGLPIPSSVEGKSLLPLVVDPTLNHREQLYFGYVNYQRGCRDGRFKLIEFAVPNKKTKLIERHTLLFDLKTDALEMNNLAVNPEHAETLERMRTLLKKKADEYGDTEERGSLFWKAMSGAHNESL